MEITGIRIIIKFVALILAIWYGLVVVLNGARGNQVSWGTLLIFSTSTATFVFLQFDLATP